VDTPPERPTAPEPTSPAASEVRQRWRLTFARAVAADAETISGRDYIELWEAAMAASGLPLATTDAGRYRFTLGAPLPARTSGRAELADLWLTERVAAWRVREGLGSALPTGHELISLEDVWLGAPALVGRVAAADYCVTLRGVVDLAALDTAAHRLLAADQLIRERAKGGGVKTYDLRPLLVSIETDSDEGSAGDEELQVRMRTRIHPELGSGRPEEVIAALGVALGSPLQPVATVRERLVLLEDLDG
jgi:radical SAM-linked protein